MDSLSCWILLSHIDPPHEIISQIPNLKRDIEDFIKTPDLFLDPTIHSKYIDKIKYFKDFNLIDRSKKYLEKPGRGVINIMDPEYPESLKNINDPPMLLYYEGDKDILSKKAIGIVGSRQASAYGIKNARSFGNQAADVNLAVVSGGAFGCDYYAHLGAMDGNGQIIVVLGSGLYYKYPKSNLEKLAAYEKSVIISEYPIFLPPQKHTFPRRNRIIPAISQALIIIEAKNRSGSLITAKYAADQGVDLYVVPGPINDERFEGSNRLIQDGAFMATSIYDLGFTSKQKGESIMGAILAAIDDKDEYYKEKLNLLKSLNCTPLSIPELERITGNKTFIYEFLLDLEIKGVVSQMNGKYYI